MSANMIVVKTPSQELELTNFCYCSSDDLKKFAIIPESSSIFVLVGNTLVISLHSHSKVSDGEIALNAVQRRDAKVSLGDQISVITFSPPAGFSLALLTVELDYVDAKANINEELDAANLAQHLHDKFNNQVMTMEQRVSFNFLGTNYIFIVKQTITEDQQKPNAIERGIIISDTYIVFESVSSSGIKIINQREYVNSNIFRQKEFDLMKLGIGGLNEEFIEIFRRAFASRVFPPHVTNKLGIKYVKGMLLYGLRGTGKTLIVRQIKKMLNGREPKIVNGYELMCKYFGKKEKIVRDLFDDAELDQRARGDQSDLHVIIIDEIDAICKSKGLIRDGTGVHDCIVNQLLTKIDGVDSSNVLLIGTTNRKDLLDEALLRPGQLEVIEVNLPDENGRLEILQIHTNTMKENSLLATDVNLQELAERTKNYNGAELIIAIKNAVSSALSRHMSMYDITKTSDEENIKATMNDFLDALQEIIPAYGSFTDDLQRYRLNGMIDCGEKHKHIYERIMHLVERSKESNDNPLVTCLLEGPTGSGKTAIAASIGINSGFPFIKVISTKLLIGLSESNQCAKINKVFEDAYTSQFSIIILDDIERLLGYFAFCHRVSTLIKETLMVLLTKPPRKGKRLFVIGTTSNLRFLKSIGFCNNFSETYHVPTLAKKDVAKVLEHLNVFKRDDIDAAAEALDGMPLKKLYTVVDVAIAYSESYRGKKKIDINRFYDALTHCV